MSTFASVTAYAVGAINSSGPTQVAQGADGRIWGYIPNSGASTATFCAVTGGGSVTSYSAPYDGISAGATLSGSNMWFTPSTGTIVLAVTTAGVYTSYTIAAQFGLRSCLGPDGRVWKVTSNNSFVSAITITGTPSSVNYSVHTGTPNETAGSICTDGTSIWVPMYASSTSLPYIAKVTTAGVVTIFALATGGSIPGGCCLGADGRIWVTAQSGTYGVWAITTSTGASVWYPQPGTPASSGQVAITLGPDGNVYAPDTSLTSLGNVWQITPAGIFTLFTGVTSVGPFSFVAFTDASGNMWFSVDGSSAHASFLYECSLSSPPQIVMIL